MDEEILNEQQEYFFDMSERVGPHFALFYLCIATDTPFLLQHVPEVITNKTETWKEYMKSMIEAGDNMKNGETAGWLDGTTDIESVFGKGLGHQDFEAAMQHEKEVLAKLPGTRVQRETWGRKGNKQLFTTNDYNRMDRMFAAYAADYRATGLSGRKEQALRRYVKELFFADKANEEGDVKSASSHFKMADLILGSEAMRAKDEKPVDGFRFDAQIDALEKAGFMKDGIFLSYEETLEAIVKFITEHGGKPRYNYSVDVVDQVLYNWENNNRKNSGRGEVYELPGEMQIHDDYGECEPEETPSEKELKRQMDLGRVKFSTD